MDKRFRVLIGILLAGCIAALLWFRLGRSPTASFPAVAVQAKPPGKDGPKPAVVASAPPQTAKEQPKPLWLEKLAGKFGLDGVAQFKLRNALYAVWQELAELRGNDAKIESQEGNKLVMYLPGLQLDDDHLTRVIAARFSECVGEQKTIALLSDEEVREAIGQRLELDMLRSGARYRFERVKPEDEPHKDFSMGYARFDVAIEYEPLRRSDGSQLNLGPHNWSRWSFADPYSIQLGWNAMSKAPSGYFRSEPIAGVQSRPEAVPTIIRDLDTGSVQILNADHPGSVEVFDPPKS